MTSGALGETHRADTPAPRPLLAGWLALFAAALILYAATANRGIQWQDPGYTILRVVTHQPLNELGLALNHPLHHWFGRLAVGLGLVNPAFAVTLVSAFGGAVTVGNIYGCVWSLTRRVWPSAFAAGSLALANTCWQMATRAEVYTVSTALLTAECWFIILYARDRRIAWLLAAFAANGLHLSNHNIALLTAPVLAVLMIQALIRREARAGHAAAAIALWLTGASLYLGMCIWMWSQTGDFTGTLRSALFSHYGDRVLSVSVSGLLLVISGLFIAYNFPNLLLPLAAYGLVRGTRAGMPRTAHRALLAGLAINTLFVLRYNVTDQFMFLTPVYVFLAIFGGMGMFAALQKLTDRRRKVLKAAAVATLLLATPAVYATTVAFARHVEFVRSLTRNKPYRNDYVYALAPWSVAEDSAPRLARDALDLAGPGGLVVVEDETARYAVAYRALSMQDPPEVSRQQDAAAAIMQAARAGRTVVLVPAVRGKTKIEPPLGRWVPDGSFYRLEIVE